MIRYKCLSIAGFDGSGGAGIQADLKTFSALGCYGMTVLTALPIQNTVGVKKCYDIPVTTIIEQLETIFEDIKPDAIKIGMLFSTSIIEAIANFLKKNAQSIPIVTDPVMIAKSGDHLLLPDAVEALKRILIPMSIIITPNLPEAYTLLGYRGDFEDVGRELSKLTPGAVLLKGGHATGLVSNDLFINHDGAMEVISAERINSKNTHGTGCTLSAAIAAFLARGYSLLDSCKMAKHYLWHALKDVEYQSVGNGHGPVNHFYEIWKD